MFCGEKMADGTLQRVTSDLCNPEVKPATKEECHEADCTGIWVAGPWGKVKYIFSNVRDLIQVVTYFDFSVFEAMRRR